MRRNESVCRNAPENQFKAGTLSNPRSLYSTVLIHTNNSLTEQITDAAFCIQLSGVSIMQHTDTLPIRAQYAPHTRLMFTGEGGWYQLSKAL